MDRLWTAALLKPPPMAVAVPRVGVSRILNSLEACPSASDACCCFGNPELASANVWRFCPHPASWLSKLAVKKEDPMQRLRGSPDVRWSVRCAAHLRGASAGPTAPDFRAGIHLAFLKPLRAGRRRLVESLRPARLDRVFSRGFSNFRGLPRINTSLKAKRAGCPRSAWVKIKPLILQKWLSK